MSNIWNQDKALLSNANPNPSLRTWRSDTSSALTTYLKDAKWSHGSSISLKLFTHFWKWNGLVLYRVDVPIDPLGLNLEVIMGVCIGPSGTLFARWPLDTPIDLSGLNPPKLDEKLLGSTINTHGPLMVGLMADILGGSPINM